MKPEPGIGYISLDYIIYKTVRRGILFLVFRPLYQLVPLARKIAGGNGKKYFVFAFIIVVQRALRNIRLFGYFPAGVRQETFLADD